MKEALNQAGVEASSTFRKTENIYYPSAIWESVPSSSRTDTSPEVAEAGSDSIAKVLTSFNTPSEVAKWPEGTEKKKNTNQGVAPDATKPPTTTQDPLAEKEASNKTEIVLAILPLPAKDELASKGPEVSETTSTQPIKAPLEEKLVIKKK